MGKRYYCDYCDKMMSCATSIIRTHNNGLIHQRAKQGHFQKFKDPEVILAEEKNKKICARFPNGQCTFGSICRFSHYSQEAIQALQNYVTTRRLTSRRVNQPSFQDLYNKLQTEKSTPRNDGNTVLIDNNGISHTLPWNNELVAKYGDSIPPSVKPITVQDFKNVTLSEWG